MPLALRRMLSLTVPAKVLDSRHTSTCSTWRSSINRIGLVANYWHRTLGGRSVGSGALAVLITAAVNISVG